MLSHVSQPGRRTSGSALPAPGIAPSVDASYDDNEISEYAIVERIGEALQEHSSGFSVDHREPSGIASDALLGCFDRSQELFAKPRTLAFVPEVSIVDVRSGSWAVRRCALQRTAANSLHDLIPWNAGRALPVEVIQASVELFALGFCQR